MKAEILKLVGAKSEAEFYRLFPTEKDFLKVHGKEFNKALRKQKIEKAQDGLRKDYAPILTPNSPTLAPYTIPQQAPELADVNRFNDNPFDKIGPVIGNVVKGFQQLKDERDALKEAKQMKRVTDVGVLASQSKDIDANKQPNLLQRAFYNNTNTGEEFFPVYGVGTNVSAKNGGKIKKANFGDIITGIGANKLTNIATEISGGDSGGATLGGTLGGAVGSIFGPVGSAVGGVVGSVAGNIFDTNPEKTKRYKKQAMGNFGKMAMANGMNATFNQNNAYMRTGGKLSSNLETDGEIDFANGGAKPISYNPYGGEMIEFNGPSHDDGGITMSFGNSPVEVEGGETAMKVDDGTLNIFGQMKAPGYGKSFKSVSKDIASKEI